MRFQKSIQFILRHKWIFILLLGVAALWGAIATQANLRIDNSVSIWFLEDNPDYQSYLEFQQERGSDEVVVAAIPTEDPLASAHLGQLKLLHQAIDSLEFVTSSFSLANARYPIYSNRQLYYRPIFNENRSRANMLTLLEELPDVQQTLFNLEASFSFFYIQLNPTDQIERERNRMVAEIVSNIQSTFPDSRISGQPILNEAFNDTIYQESSQFAVLTIIIILILLLVLLPNRWYLPLALISIAVPVASTMGIMTSMGYSLNLISMLIPTILMVYAVSDVVHIVNIYEQERKLHPELDKQERIKLALYKSLRPCFYTTLTTVIGYLALYLSPLPAFKVMGIFTFLGLVLAFFMVYIIAAIGLYFTPDNLESQKRFQFNLGGLIRKVNFWTTHRQGVVLLSGFLFFILGLVSLFFIQVNTDSLNLLGEGKAKADLELIEDLLGGNARLQINIKKKDESQMLSRGEMNQLANFQARLDSNKLLSNPISVVDFREFMEKRLPPLTNISTSRLAKLLSEPKDQENAFFSFYSKDFSEVSIAIHVKELDTQDLELLLATIEKDFISIFSPEQYEIKVHGFLALFAQLNRFILQTQFRSFAAAFIIAFFILFYFIVKVKTTILALIPNLLPLAMCLIVMAIFRIDLEAANAMLAPIMLGVAMDDTIHLMNHYNLLKKAGVPKIKAMDASLQYTGGALFSTTISLVCGFMVVGWSGVASVSTFGLLCAFTIVAALFADVIFLPALMKRFDRDG